MAIIFFFFLRVSVDLAAYQGPLAQGLSQDFKEPAGSVAFLRLFLVEKAMATHSSTLAWKMPWMEEPGGL